MSKLPVVVRIISHGGKGLSSAVLVKELASRRTAHGRREGPCLS